MPDHSALDARYFIDDHVYNCPFCNRRNVAYYVTNWFTFHWTATKKCMVVFVRCESCKYISMHLTYSVLGFELVMRRDKDSIFHFKDLKQGQPIDELFFYSVPTSFFVINEHVPKILRELVTEAEGCLKSNFLTGASACIRKVIYELAIHQHASGGNYDERLKSLKDTHPEVESAFFDTLLTIQEMTSAKVHEQSYDGWSSSHVRVILAALEQILNELYVVPQMRAEQRQAILKMKEELQTKPKRETTQEK
ncbi:MAG TPA: hypothetical protein VFK05_36660 [Polyangiaceae bacterium]|nr:hypothetical protein [Polyangiaceae bacterium]